MRLGLSSWEEVCALLFLLSRSTWFIKLPSGSRCSSTLHSSAAAQTRNHIIIIISRITYSLVVQECVEEYIVECIWRCAEQTDGEERERERKEGGFSGSSLLLADRWNSPAQNSIHITYHIHNTIHNAKMQNAIQYPISNPASISFNYSFFLL